MSDTWNYIYEAFRFYVYKKTNHRIVHESVEGKLVGKSAERYAYFEAGFKAGKNFSLTGGIQQEPD